MSRSIREILKLCGSAAALARAINRKPEAVRQWFRASRKPPANAAADIARVARERGHEWCTTDVVLAAMLAGTPDRARKPVMEGQNA
jgi:hypothetical protein